MSLYLPMLDRQRSPFGGGNFSRAYTPYGAIIDAGGPATGFCGQLRDRVTGSYPLGNGNRFYSPEIMRFQSPDRLSPFAAGGINAYSYCAGNPVDNWDPSGGTKRLLSDPIDMIAPGISTVVGAATTGILIADTWSSFKSRAQVAELKKHSNDPDVLNMEEVTRTRLVQKVVATTAAGGSTLASAAGVVGAPVAVPVQITLAGLSAAALGLDQISSRREAKHRADPLNFMKRSAGTYENKIIAGQKLLNRELQKNEKQSALSSADYESRLEQDKRVERQFNDAFNGLLISIRSLSDW